MWNEVCDEIRHVSETCMSAQVLRMFSYMYTNKEFNNFLRHYVSRTHKVYSLIVLHVVCVFASYLMTQVNVVQ